MTARVVKNKSARWQVFVPWIRDGHLSDVVAAEIVTTSDPAPVLTLKVIGGREITFPLERAKLLSDALREAVESLESEAGP